MKFEELARESTWRRGGGRRLEDGDGVLCGSGDLSAPAAAPGGSGHWGAQVYDLAEERGAAVVASAVVAVVPGRGREVRYYEEGSRGVGDPGEATEVGEEGNGAGVAGGRRRDQMRRAEGEGQRR